MAGSPTGILPALQKRPAGVRTTTDTQVPAHHRVAPPDLALGPDPRTRSAPDRSPPQQDVFTCLCVQAHLTLPQHPCLLRGALSQSCSFRGLSRCCVVSRRLPVSSRSRLRVGLCPSLFSGHQPCGTRVHPCDLILL